MRPTEVGVGPQGNQGRAGVMGTPHGSGGGSKVGRGLFLLDIRPHASGGVWARLCERITSLECTSRTLFTPLGSGRIVRRDAQYH